MNLPPLNARVSSEVVDVGPPLTPEQAKVWREKHGIPDPSRPLVPTTSELNSLPRTARVAFIQRCTKRVAPLTGTSSAEEINPQIAANLILAAATLHTPLKRLFRCIRRDYDRLFRLSRSERWTDDTPVSQEVFGPMWPKDLVPEWAKESLQ
jgi:hypothetical protein